MISWCAPCPLATRLSHILYSGIPQYWNSVGQTQAGDSLRAFRETLRPTMSSPLGLVIDLFQSPLTSPSSLLSLPLQCYTLYFNTLTTHRFLDSSQSLCFCSSFSLYGDILPILRLHYLKKDTRKVGRFFKLQPSLV